MNFAIKSNVITKAKQADGMTFTWAYDTHGQRVIESSLPLYVDFGDMSDT